MTEKAIIGKMSLYELMTMIVPGTMIVFCVWLLEPQYWMHFLDKAGYITHVNYLYDIALVVVVFVFAYLAGLLNYLIIDGFWRLFRLRNNTCMLKSSLKEKSVLPNYLNLNQLINKLTKDNAEILELKEEQIEDIYYEAYTYALKHNERSNIPFLENQVAMLKGLILPTSCLVFLLFDPTTWLQWVLAIAIVSILVVMAICRQKKTIELVLEDYEYEKRIEK